jgi:hypothetical protein
LSNDAVTIGMIFVILGWLVQLYYGAGKKIFALSLKFVLIYCIGNIVLGIAALKAGHPFIGALYVLTFIFACFAGYFSMKARR